MMAAHIARIKILRIILSVLAFVALSTSAYAHGGGLDRNGCHHDHQTGGYHCH